MLRWTRPGLPEALLVIAVMSVLVGLLLPATQSAREAANRAESRAKTAQSGHALPSDFYVNDAASGLATRGGEAPTTDALAQQGIVVASADPQRKIIYEARISVVVDDLDEVAATIAARLKEFGGYIAEASVAGAQGEQRTGTWQVRVPVAQFEAFVAALEQAGVVENVSQGAHDVSEEYVDLEARIANQQRLEERIVKLLEATDDKISDVIEVERQLARVRGEIERMQGRLRYLTNRVELTTVTVVVREQHDYVPPVAPTFATRIATAWSNSLGALQQFGERLTLAVVAVVPWFVSIGVPLAAVVSFAVRSRRHRAA